MVLTITIAVLILLVLLFLVLTMEFRKLNKKLDKVGASTSFLEAETKTRNAEYKARKDWRSYRERNLPRTEAPRVPRSSMSTEDMKRKADELEQEMNS